MTSSIKVLSEVEHLRLRPGMYVGDISQPKVLVKEMVDNALDEMLNGHASKITIDADTKSPICNYRVRDNGRGLPLSPVPEMDNAVAAKVLFTKMHAGGKFDHSNYDYSVGLHAVGMKVVNAMSTLATIRVNDRKNEQVYYLETREGVIEDEKFIPYSELSEEEKSDLWWSTEIYCEPDDKIFKSTKTTVSEISLQLAKAISPNSEVIYNGLEVEPFDMRKEFGTTYIRNDILTMACKVHTLKVELSFGWSANEFNSQSRGSINLSPCNEGMHIRTVQTCIGKAMQRINGELTTNDGQVGLRLFCVTYTSDPIFTSQSKERLSWVGDRYPLNYVCDKLNFNFDFSKCDKARMSLMSDEFRRIADLANHEDKFNLELVSYLEKYPELTGVTRAQVQQMNHERQKVVDDFIEELTTQLESLFRKSETVAEVIFRIVEYKKSLANLTEREFINSVVQKGNNKRTMYSVKGIRECTISDRSKAELYICEGKSAGGNLIKESNRLTQAVLPLRGKFLNAASLANVQEALENEEMRSLINGIGVGFTPDVDLSCARYGKIIIATDADSDGLHIRALILGALAYMCPEVIESGMLYIVVPPLYKQDDKYFTDEEGLNKSKHFERYKGLGSMDAIDLKSSLLDVKNRKLVQITSKDTGALLDIMTESSERKDIMIEAGYLIETL